VATIEAVSPQSLQQAAELLKKGELVAFPTETVYGLGADAASPDAVARIFAAKGRPSNHPVIVHVRGKDDAARWAAELPPAAHLLMDRFWPGPLTLILPRAAGVPDAVTGGQDTVGIRCPGHPVAQALLRALADAGGSGALAAPSANRFGRISPTTAQHVASEFGDRIPLVLDGGACQVGIESTILDLSRGRPVLLRPGHVGAAELQDVLGETVWLPDGRAAVQPTDARRESSPESQAATTDTPRVSGALAAHYAPRTPMTLAAPGQLTSQVQAALQQGGRVGVWSSETPPAHPGMLWRAAPDDAAAFAHALYATLREFDAAGLDHIFVQEPPRDADWAAVADRLGRAVTGSGKS
jgi:L-threonylcarbamoyladenylate synthase